MAIQSVCAFHCGHPVYTKEVKKKKKKKKKEQRKKVCLRKLDSGETACSNQRRVFLTFSVTQL